MLGKDKQTFIDFQKAVQYEWLETNGLGGWCSSTLAGCNTRRYHGLLVAATDPPTGRTNLLSKLDETILIDDKRFDLGCNEYGGQFIKPSGYQFLESFSKGLCPQWIFQAGGIRLRKRISMVHEANTTLLIYEVIQAPCPFQLELLPQVAARDYHSLQHSNDVINPEAHFIESVFRAHPYEGVPEIYISVPGATYFHDPKWYYGFNYRIEKARGLDYVEDLFNYGCFRVTLKQGDELGIMISTDAPDKKNARQLFDRQNARKQNLLEVPFRSSTFQYLALAADQFIVKRMITPAPPDAGEIQASTVIAGYHWFTDWSRDTMISLPGLCLATGRFEDARNILKAFACSVNMGMLPNRFPDQHLPPQYNTVDGTLWFFIAVHEYFQATQDKEFVLGSLLAVLNEIIEWHFRGTRFNIHVTEDGLLSAGQQGQQLTWMDAKVGDWVITPRMGKPVEIQALWYNAQMIYAGLLQLNGQLTQAAEMFNRAAFTQTNFLASFWNDSANCLFDVLDLSGRADSCVRPNQIFAISLPHALIDSQKAQSVLQTVQEELYTPFGLRSLSPKDSNYVGIYDGDPAKRDSSYHQGTVWCWLLGPYVDALMKTPNGTDEAEKVIGDAEIQLNEYCIGTMPEIFDGNSPHTARGCAAQAWSVAELLRVRAKYKLGNSRQ